MFATEKAKITKDVLDKKIFAIDILTIGIFITGTLKTATPVLQFL